MARVLIRNRREDTDTENAKRRRQRLELCIHKLRDTWRHWKLDKARKDSPPESSKRVQPCKGLDFRLLVSIIVRE